MGKSKNKRKGGIQIIAPGENTGGRKEGRYEWKRGKWNGHPMMMEGASANANSQEMPHWVKSHVPKAAPMAPTIPETTQSETNAAIKGSEKITADLKEILRYRKRLYDLRSVWQGFVKIADILATHPMKELKRGNQYIEWALGEGSKTVDGGTWKDGKFIRLKWYGPTEENQMRLEGERDRSSDRRQGEEGGEGDVNFDKTNEGSLSPLSLSYPPSNIQRRNSPSSAIYLTLSKIKR